MFGRKRIRELEARVKGMREIIHDMDQERIRQDEEIRKLKNQVEDLHKSDVEHKKMIRELARAGSDDVEFLDLLHRRLADREARHEMDVKERLDEYAVAILANERDVKALAERGERRTISDMVNEQADMDKASTARILDEWLNGKKEGTDDE